jgi:predicted double-glycine peptidase
MPRLVAWRSCPYCIGRFVQNRRESDMHIYFYWIIATLVNSVIIITAVDVILMGAYVPVFSKKLNASKYVVSKENRIELQKRNDCAGYSVAYILRHYNIAADGTEVYERISNKTTDGYVYPKEIKKVVAEFGFQAKYCAGNLNALKNEVSKGHPIIVFIRVKRNERWLHYVPVVGYDEKNIYLADSLEECVNCNEQKYNRKISNEDFKLLWNTSMLKMPLYTNTYFKIIEKQNSSKFK